MSYAEEVRRFFAWHIKTNRLVRASLRMSFENAPKAEAERTSKAEALQMIEEARQKTAEKIAADLNEGKATKRQASAGRRALLEMMKKATEQAEALR